MQPDPKKRTGTGEKKPGLSPVGGTGEYAKSTVGKDGKSYTGKVYKSDPQRTQQAPLKKPAPPDTTRHTPRFSGSMDSHPAQYAKDMFDHTVGKEPVKKKATGAPQYGKATFETYPPKNK